MIVVAESTSVYDYHIFAFLLEKFASINVDIQVYPVNAKTVANYKKAYMEAEKGDSGDAYICADFGRVGRTRNLKPFEAGQNTIQYGFDFTRDSYIRKYEEARHNKHKHTLVLTSRKLIRLIFTLLRDNKMYVSMSHDMANN